MVKYIKGIHLEVDEIPFFVRIIFYGWKTFSIYYENKVSYIVKKDFHADEKTFPSPKKILKMQYDVL